MYPDVTAINIMKLHLKLKTYHTKQLMCIITYSKSMVIKEDVYNFSILIKACTEAGLYEKAIEVFYQIQSTRSKNK